jgi:hypothetical protein
LQAAKKGVHAKRRDEQMSNFINIFKILIKPRVVLLSLPQDRILWAGFAVPLLVGLATGLRKDSAATLGWGGMLLAAALVLVIAYPLLGFLLKLILRLFHREISLYACLNLFNYSQSPRLISALAFGGMALARQADNPILLLTSAIIGYIAVFYSLYMFFHGLALLSKRRLI